MSYKDVPYLVGSMRYKDVPYLMDKFLYEMFHRSMETATMEQIEKVALVIKIVCSEGGE